MANNETYRVTCRRGDAPLFMARVRKNDGNYITQATTSTITYTLYTLSRSEPSSRTAVTNHSAQSVTVASAVYDALQTGTLWGSKDTTGYNFAHQPSFAATILTSIGVDQYLLEYTITPTTGQTIRLGFLISVTV